jgi:hypothetical protein
MKNLFKLFGIISLVTVIGFSIAACDNNSGAGDSGSKATVIIQNRSPNPNEIITLVGIMTNTSMQDIPVDIGANQEHSFSLDAGEYYFYVETNTDEWAQYPSVEQQQGHRLFAGDTLTLRWTNNRLQRN